MLYLFWFYIINLACFHIASIDKNLTVFIIQKYILFMLNPLKISIYKEDNIIIKQKVVV